MKLTIINIGISNLGSLLEALRRIGVHFEVVEDSDAIAGAESVILPGVGAFRDGMSALERLAMVEPLRNYASSGRPLFGICLGMQMLFDSSAEMGFHEGLGILSGRVIRLESSLPEARIPNMGWCDVTTKSRGGNFFREKPESYYFLHSYWCKCTDAEDVAATIDFGIPVTAAVEHQNIRGVQFHPEKSQDVGLDLLERLFHQI